MKLKISSPVVTANWLHDNIKSENLIVLDATITKIGTEKNTQKEKQQIPNAVFFDLKKVFLNKEGQYPNTVPSEKVFEVEVQKLGIHKDSCIVVYDDIGVYSSPRAWWLFKLFGFENVAVLNGGLPAWKAEGFLVEKQGKNSFIKGSFKTNYQKNSIIDTNGVLKAVISKEYEILDARSHDRFHAIVPEPRKDLRGGHIPTSKSLPFTQVQNGVKMKTKEELIKLLAEKNPENKELIFSCGSGITACVLALACEITANKNYRVYDGSWTEWASKLELPIEK
ncbi:MAG: sulfurtransferase [Tenacibaculum sp.]